MSSNARQNGVFDAWALPSGSLLHEDDDLVVVCKPAGVSVAAPERGPAHDLIARIRRIRPDRGAYLRPHLHLDRDVSGLVAFASSRDANVSLAKQALSTTVTFLACVIPARRFAHDGTLRCWVRKSRSGVLEPIPIQQPGAKESHVAYRVLDRHDDRYIIDARCSLGSRGIRAVLASARAPVVGDTELSGPQARRLMLHASAMTLQHPRSGHSLEFETKVPRVFRQWIAGHERVEDIDNTTVLEAIVESATSRFALVADGLVDAVRLIHGEAEGMRGLDIEWFGRHAVLWLNEDADRNLVDSAVDAVSTLGPDGVYVKKRPKQASRIVNARGALLVNPNVVRGSDAAHPLTVHEHGLNYLVELREGLSTGLFLDQRSNRTWIRQNSQGKSVLNLFAYTCAFSVAAAAGGARHTVSVDISKRSLDVGRRNLTINGLNSTDHAFVCDDVLAWVASAGAQRFDIVVLDPPSFGTSHRGRFAATRDYVGLATACISLIEERGGLLLACTNHRAISFRKLRGWIQQAADQAGRHLERLDEVEAEPDFPAISGLGPHMKAIRASVGPPIEREKGRSNAEQRITKRQGRPRAHRKPR